MKEEKECLNCGKKFIPICHITRQKFCSDTCRYDYNNAKRNYKVPVNICPACGDIVDQKECQPGRWRRFCSDQYRVTYHHQKVLAERRNRARLIKYARIARKCFSWNGGQEVSGNSAVTPAGSNAGKSTTRRIHRRNCRQRNVRFAEHH